MFRTVPDFPKLLKIVVSFLRFILFPRESVKDAFPGLVNGIQYRRLFDLQHFHIGGHELVAQSGQFGNIAIGLVLPNDGAHLRHNILQHGVHNIGLAVIVDCQHIQRPHEDLLLFPGKERFHWVIILCKIHEVITHL